jgi:hypothetical protein
MPNCPKCKELRYKPLPYYGHLVDSHHLPLPVAASMAFEENPIKLFSDPNARNH